MRAVVFLELVERPPVDEERDVVPERVRDADPPERLDERDDEPPERDEEPEDEPDDFVSPAAARCLLTVRAAISFARPVDRP